MREVRDHFTMFESFYNVIIESFYRLYFRKGGKKICVKGSFERIFSFESWEFMMKHAIIA